MTAMMQWEIDQQTIRDCPGGRTEVEWRQAVRDKERSLHKERVCSRCHQSLAGSFKYQVTETEAWTPGDKKNRLPRGRWGLSAYASTLKAARILRDFMGPRATIWINRRGTNSYRRLENSR